MKKAGAHRAVFADPSGRRRRLVVAAGIAVGCLLTACLVITVAGGGVPFASWPAAKPSHRDAEPREELPPLNTKPSPSVTKRPAPSTSPTRPSPTPTHSAPATVRPSTTSPTTRPSRGHGHGFGHPPHPKRS